MATYTAKIYRRVLSSSPRFWQLQLILEYEDKQRLTAREFKTIISAIFDISCEGGIDNKHLYAEVSRDGKEIFDIYANSYVDGSVVDCLVSISRFGERRRYYRTMNIAC